MNTSDQSTPATQPSFNRVPRATYRLQLGAEVGFAEAQALVPYLDALGISDLYLSPLFRSRTGSTHGYDVVDPSRIEPDFGSLAAFESLAVALRERGMGLLLDVVPNHMGINDPANRWWLDVLENGEDARHADWFDIDWHPPNENLHGRVLLPTLADHFGKELEAGKFQLIYRDDRLQLTYGEAAFPVAPPTWTAVVEAAIERLPESPDRSELESIATQLRHLPQRTGKNGEATRERYREQRIAARRLAAHLRASPSAQKAWDEAIEQFNGHVGDPRSFQALEALIEGQCYRLAFWRVGGDEINYRRFFDVTELAALRVEHPEVFSAVHHLVARMLDHAWVTGLRIDHPDGLLDPQGYFSELQRLWCESIDKRASDEDSQLYVVAEKILTGDEPLPCDWPVAGTTGYEMLNTLSWLLVDAKGLRHLQQAWEEITGERVTATDVHYESKQTILRDVMSSELHVLASHLYRLAQQDRHSRDFTFPTLLRALREFIACFPVYRSYVRPDTQSVGEADRKNIQQAIAAARRRAPWVPSSALEFIRSLLLLETSPALAEEEQRAQLEDRRRFALKLQQVTGPVMAKGVEDTALYRYYPLAALNEVGGLLDPTPLSIADFHRHMQQRAKEWPHSMTATATHDTKRGEDTRARLLVLSEIADEWLAKVKAWQQLTKQFVEHVGNRPAPSRAEQYLIFQTLVGTWPQQPDADRSTYIERINTYLQKALREAKQNTSWLNPDEEYEQAISNYVERLLDGKQCPEFITQLDQFVNRISWAGVANSLAQVVLKICMPGVPDFYQGTEFWDFSLVDPDNRRPIDFDERRQRLEEFSVNAPASVRQWMKHGSMFDPSLKLSIVSRALSLRRAKEAVFTSGEYLPLVVEGSRADHVVAFARRWRHEWVVAITMRHPLRLRGKSNRIDWGNTVVRLPESAPHTWRDALLGAKVQSAEITLTDALADLPVALLAAGPS